MRLQKDTNRLREIDQEMKLSVYLCEKHKDALAQTSIIVFIRASQKQECQELNCYEVGEYTTIIQTGETQNANRARN
jgi:hypothetical protein